MVMEQILDKKYYIRKIVKITSTITDEKQIKIWSDIIERIQEYPETIFRRAQLHEYLCTVAPIRYIKKSYRNKYINRL